MIKNCEEEEEILSQFQSPMSVLRYENDIYFYSAVDADSILNLVLHLKDATKLSRDLLLRFPKDNKLGVDIQLPIIIHINSNGGSVYDVIAAVDTIQQYKNMGFQINTIIEGCAFSAATILASCGSKRFITENSTYMIHEMSSTGFSGKTSDIERLSESMKTTTEIFENLYVKTSKLTLKQIKRLMKSEEHMNSKKVLELGLVDEILS